MFETPTSAQVRLKTAFNPHILSSPEPSYAESISISCCLSDSDHPRFSSRMDESLAPKVASLLVNE